MTALIRMLNAEILVLYDTLALKCKEIFWKGAKSSSPAPHVRVLFLSTLTLTVSIVAR